MILIGIGGNLPSQYGSPLQTCAAALEAVERAGLRVLRRSRWYRTAPVPVSDQPWYINGVAMLAGPAEPGGVLAVLNDIEAAFGRVRSVRNGARIIDLDLLAHGGVVMDTPRLQLPHPRLHERAFVLVPLAEVMPGWRHPVSGRMVEEMVADLPAQQLAEVFAE